MVEKATPIIKAAAKPLLSLAELDLLCFLDLCYNKNIMETLILPIIGFVFLLVLFGLRIVDQYERGVMLTLGKYTGTRSPGLTWILF